MYDEECPCETCSNKENCEDGKPPTAVFCVIGAAEVTVKTVIRLIFNGGMNELLRLH